MQQLADLSAFLRRAVLATAVVAGAFIAWRLAPVLIGLFGGLLFAVVLRNVAAVIERYTRLPRTWGVGLLLLVFFVALGFGVWEFGTQLGDQFQQLTTTVTGSYRAVTAWLQAHGIDLASTNLEGALMSGVSLIGGTVYEVLTGGLVVLFVMIYVALSPHVYRKGFVLLFPKPWHARLKEVLDALETALWRWMLGQLISMAGVGIATGIALWMLGVPLAGLLGLISGLLEFVPVLGPWLAAVPSALVALSVSPMTAVWAMVAYTGIQQVESWLLTPLAVRYAVALPPAVTVLAIAALGALFGLAGVLFATPIALVIMVAVRMLYVRDTLDERLAKTRMPQ